jgi:hypothetical protein
MTMPKMKNGIHYSVKDIYFVIVLLFSGLAFGFSRSDGGIITLFSTTIFWGLAYRVNYSKPVLWESIGIFILYSIITALRNGEFLPFFTFRYITAILIAYTLFSLYSYKFFYLFEKTIFILALISLFFFLFESVNSSLFMSVINKLGLSQGYFSAEGSDVYNAGGSYYNFLVYTVGYYPNQILQRNYGFCWEPGPFSIYLNMAITLNLYRTSNTLPLRKNTIFWLLVVTLITTLSTTGYLVFFVTIICYILERSRNRSRYVYLIIFSSIFIILFLYLPFLNEKIKSLYLSGLNINDTIDLALSTGISRSGGRFGGFAIAWKDFLKYPILGTGGYSQLSYGRGVVAIINGIANILSTFGIFGVFLFLYLLKKSSLCLSIIYKNNLRSLLFVVILFSSFGFGITSQYMLFSFIFLSLFFPKSTYNKYYKRFNNIRKCQVTA